MPNLFIHPDVLDFVEDATFETSFHGIVQVAVQLNPQVAGFLDMRSRLERTHREGIEAESESAVR